MPDAPGIKLKEEIKETLQKIATKKKLKEVKEKNVSGYSTKLTSKVG